MIKKNAYLTFITTSVLLHTFASISNAEGTKKEQASFRVHKACTTSETWDFGNSGLTPEIQDAFSYTVSKGFSPTRGFAEALDARKTLESPVQKAFAEYWASRALFDGGLYHVAWSGLSVIVSQPVVHASVTEAALACMAAIHAKNPAFEFPAKAADNFAEIQKGPQLAKAVLIHLKNEAAKGEVKESKLLKLLSFTEAGGLYYNVAQVIVYSRLGMHREAAQAGEQYFASTAFPDQMGDYADTVHLLTGRSYYAVKNFSQAADHFKKVTRDSNELAQSLSDVTWAYLMQKKYADAIGTAIGLQSGGLRKTFAPEAMMVLSMALNELCQFQDSQRAVAFMRKTYDPVYKWLLGWVEQGKKEQGLYRLAINAVKKQKIDVPDRIAGEWIRSPSFYQRQEEINIMYKEQKSAELLGEAAENEQKMMVMKLLNETRRIKPGYVSVKQKLQPGDPLPASMKRELANLKDQMSEYKRFKAAARPWRKILANQQVRSKKREGILIKEIETTFANKNLRMFETLEDIADNSHLISVEILQGASRDLVWQNAHPDFADISRKIASREQSEKREQSWNWGNVDGGLQGGVEEIWEDEVGAFAADVSNNCLNKEKYLSIKRKERR